MQEMLNFCADHGITCDIEAFENSMDQWGYPRIFEGDVLFRLVIDMASLQIQSWRKGFGP
jgi:uncharacterized zinc-type alcohol dehydrogenase-like protein